jgi:tetratricopeptide (TPR) repeat protein
MGKSYFELEGEFAGKRGRYFYEYIKNLKTHTATDLEFHRELADLYFRENEYEKAIPEYQQVLLFSPQDLKSRVLLGEIYIIQGQLGQALFNYREAVKINPANKVIKRRLSELEEVIEEYTKNTKKKQT